MRHDTFSRREFLSVIVGTGHVLVAGSVLAAGMPIAVVTGPQTAPSSLSLDKLRRIFLAKPTDNDAGQPFVPINHAQSSSVREQFDRRVLHMEPDEAARFWIDQRLRGKKPPRVAASLEMVRRAVSEIPGAISYLPYDAVASLRVLLVDGARPSDPAYPLR